MNSSAVVQLVCTLFEGVLQPSEPRQWLQQYEWIHKNQGRTWQAHPKLHRRPWSSCSCSMCCGRCQGVSDCALYVTSIVQAEGAVRPRACTSTSVRIVAQRVRQHAAVSAVVRHDRCCSANTWLLLRSARHALCLNYWYSELLTLHKAVNAGCPAIAAHEVMQVTVIVAVHSTHTKCGYITATLCIRVIASPVLQVQQLFSHLVRDRVQWHNILHASVIQWYNNRCNRCVCYQFANAPL
jgi:hypothetical protein